MDVRNTDYGMNERVKMTDTCGGHVLRSRSKIAAYFELISIYLHQN